MDVARPRRIPRGLAQPVPPGDAHEAARAERRGRADAGRTSRGSPRGSSRWPADRCCWPSATASADCSIGSSASSDAATSSSSCSATCGAIRKTTTTRWSCLAEAFRVPVVATGGVRFADARGAAALRRADDHPRAHDARCGRPAAGGQRRALSEAARADGAAVCRSPGGASARRWRWPSGCSSR